MKTMALAVAIGICASAQATTTEQDSVETTMTMSEVVIKSTLPKTRVKGDAMRTIVNGSDLEKTGTIQDMLKYVPQVSTEGDKVSVTGRGEAEIYINGRRVYDSEELERLRAEDVMYVDVVNNPGARYSASTKAVVRITMKRPQGEGWGVTNMFTTYYQYNWTLSDVLDVNYRNKGLDVSAQLQGMTYGFGQEQTLTLTSMAGDKVLQQVGRDHTRGRLKNYSPQLQLNYVFNPNHSMGLRYNFSDMPWQHATAHLTTDITLDGTPQERTISSIFHDWVVRQQTVNMYYNGRIKDWTIDLNTDGVFSKHDMPIVTTEETISGGSSTTQVVENQNTAANNLYAAKLDIGHPLWGGNLHFGSEYSYNLRKDNNVNPQHIVSDTHGRVQEHIVAGFAEYARQWGTWGLNAGLRYEYVDSKYFEKEVQQQDASRTYGDLFPSLSLSKTVGQAQFSLSYAQDIERPAYNTLSSKLMYVNRYTFQSGNPRLLPTYAHNLILNGAYRWVALTLGFKRTKDEMSLVTDGWNEQDPSISLMHCVNLDAYNSGYASLTLAPTIAHIWHPQWTATLNLQDYAISSPLGDVHLNHPLFQLKWNNTLTLPHHFTLMAVATFTSKGDTGNARLNKATLQTQFVLQRSFLRDRLDVTASISNPFEWANQDMTLYSAREMRTDARTPRQFLLRLTYKFNESHSKYKGTGAGQAQKARLKS